MAAARLLRSVADRKIAGLCAGFAERYGYDPSIVRLVWVFLTLVTGVVPGVFTYLIAWLIVPPVGRDGISAR